MVCVLASCRFAIVAVVPVGMISISRWILWATVLLWGSAAARALAAPGISLVTGANGYVGREVVHALLEKQEGSVGALVRPHKMEAEARYWEGTARNVQVLRYDMTDGGESLSEAIDAARASSPDIPICVYHVASVFGPTEDPVATARENVDGTLAVVQVLAQKGNCRLVLTSSMAAVRGTGQEPLNGNHYTYEDWNTLSQLSPDNWGSCYQWSKAESERQATDLAAELGVPMASICPSFVFGPPTRSSVLEDSQSFAVALVRQWLEGGSEVQSRLCVDVRDVAAAHVKAGTAEGRFLVTAEARISSERTAGLLRTVLEDEFPNLLGDSSEGGLDPNAISFDAVFQGGAIPIGAKEADCEDRLLECLGVSLRPVEDT